MNKADEIRDKIRQMRYLAEEKKFIDDLIHKLDEQKNRLHLEELCIRTMLSDQCMYSSFLLIKSYIHCSYC